MAAVLLRLLEDLAAREVFQYDTTMADLYNEAKPLLEAHARGTDLLGVRR